MPIANQSMTKTLNTTDVQQHSAINFTQKSGAIVPGLIENSYNTNDASTLQHQQQQQVPNTIDSNPIEKPQVYHQQQQQQQHENVSSVQPTANSITTSTTTITQQSFDSLNLNVSNLNTNLNSNLNQVSPKDSNQTTSQTNTTTVITSNNNNNNNNNNNVIQGSPSSAGNIASLTSIQSNTSLTTSMSTISSLDHTGTTNGPDSINDIVDNLNVEQKSSRLINFYIHKRFIMPLFSFFLNNEYLEKQTKMANFSYRRHLYGVFDCAVI
jgi:hypothetical protein